MTARRVGPMGVNLGLATALLLAIAGGIAWLDSIDPQALRQRLIGLQFWALELLLVLVVALSTRQLPGLIRSLHFRTRDWVAIGAAVLLAGILAAFVAPRTNRIYYDEQIYQGIGHNLSDLRRAQMCHEGVTEYGALRCFRGEYNKQPNGYPHLLSVGYRALGVSEGLAHWLNIGVMMAHVLAIALLAGAWFRTSLTSIAAALVFATIPQQSLWSATAAAEPSASLACSLAMLAAVHFTRTRSTESLLWTVVVSAWAVQFRPESVLILPLVALVIFLEAPEELPTTRMLVAAGLGAALLGVHAAHLMAVRSEGWGASGARFSAAHLRTNLPVNGWFYLADWRFPAAYGVAAMMGAMIPGGWRARAVVIAYFVSFFGIYLFFYAGSYNYGADVRYSLMTYPPVAVLAGRTIAFAHQSLRHRKPMASVGMAAFTVNVLLYLPLIRSTGEEAWAARADVRYAKQFAASLPDGALVLTHNPHMFHLWGRNAAQMSIAIHEPAFMTSARDRFRGGVYLHWNFWCNVDDPVQRDLCSTLLAREGGQVQMEAHERDYRYALIKLAR